MPIVRGSILPEVQSVGRAKPYLDILLWYETLNDSDLSLLNELDHLRIYLDQIPIFCDIRISIPRAHTKQGPSIATCRFRLPQ